MALGSRYRGVVGGFHFRTPARSRALSALGCHGRSRVEVVSGGRGGRGGRRTCPLSGAVPVFSPVVALGSRHRGVVGGFHFRTPARSHALSALGCHGRRRVEVGSGGPGGGARRRACFLSGAGSVFFRRRGARLTLSRCRRWFPFPYACARARPLGCHGPRRVEVGSGGRGGGGGRRTCPFSGAVPVFSRRRGPRLTSSRCFRWFPFPHACARALPRALSVAMGHAVLRLGRAGAAVGVGETRVPLVGSLPSSPAVVALGSRHRGVVTVVSISARLRTCAPSRLPRTTPC